jgi:hypothetical protein
VNLETVQEWTCPNCHREEQTRLPYGTAASRFHPCPGLGGLTAPMIPAGLSAKVTAEERQDYAAGEMVTCDAAGRVVMAVRTTRDDGDDLAVFAPCAVMHLRGGTP